MSIVEKIRKELTSESAKRIFNYCKQKDLSPIRCDKMTLEQEDRYREILGRIYSFYSYYNNEEHEYIPVQYIHTTKDFEKFVCQISTPDERKIPIYVDTNPSSLGIYQCEENISALKEGYVFNCEDECIGGFLEESKDTNSSEMRYFTFRDISPELE